MKKSKNDNKQLVRPDGYRLIGGAIMIRDGDKVYHEGGEWKNAVASVGMSVSEAKKHYGKHFSWARKKANNVSAVDAPEPKNIVIKLAGDDNAKPAKEAKPVVPHGAIPAGYAPLVYGQIKQNGDMFFSDTGEWKPVVKSIGKFYKQDAKNTVVRPVAKILGVKPAKAVLVEEKVVMPQVVNKNDHNRFIVGQSVSIQKTHGNKKYQGLKGTVIAVKNSKNKLGAKSFVLDLAKSPYPDNGVIDVRGEFLAEV